MSINQFPSEWDSRNHSIYIMLSGPVMDPAVTAELPPTVYQFSETMVASLHLLYHMEPYQWLRNVQSIILNPVSD